MAKLDCKPHLPPNSRGGTNIWFCCHPDDFEDYFDTITTDFKKQCNSNARISNISFWFDKEPLEDYDEVKFLSDLSEMKLFIVAVTRKFLTENSRARLVELKYAADNRIPILPLMLESGLDSLFHSVFGCIQYLTPKSGDATEISYKDKISSFWEIFLDDDLKKRIENEFDATLFLSYRKIDRGYAQKLMEIIHQNNRFRDVAIWYDEFLTPGENYNVSISDALKSSNVFVMTVTPNIIAMSRDRDGNACENYIVTTEYPLAYELGKPIIACEMVHTGMQIHKKFNDLPYYIPEGYTYMLYEELERKLEGIPLGAKRGDPEHEYLIGMAYFTGTCVERNKAKGIQLITDAAENGNIEAMRRLSAIYGTGDGVMKDDAKKLEWLTKVADSFKQKLENTENLDRKWVDRYLDSYIRSIHTANISLTFSEKPLFIEVNIAECMKMYEKLKDITPQAIDILVGVYGSYLLYGSWGMIQKEKKRFLLLALETSKKIFSEEKTRSELFSLSEVYLDLAKIVYEEKNYREADDYAQLALDNAEKAMNESGRIKSYLLLMNAAMHSPDMSALEQYLKCCVLCSKTNFALDQTEKSVEYLQKAADKAEPYAKNGENRGVRVNYTETVSALMMHYLNKNDTVAAKNYYEKTLSSFDLIEKGVFGKTSDDTAVYLRICAYLENERSYSLAERYYLKALQMNEFPTETMKARMFAANIIIYKKLESLCKKNRAEILSQSYRNRAEFFDSELRLKHPGVSVQYELAALNAEYYFIPNLQADTSADNENNSAGEQYCTRLYNSAQSHIKSGNIHLSVGNTEKAKENFRKAADILRDISAKNPENADFSSALALAEEKLKEADHFVAPTDEKKKKKSIFSVFKRK